MGYVHAHAPSMGDIFTELDRGPCGTGGVWRVMTVRSNGVAKNNEERSRAVGLLPWYRAT